MSISDPPLQLTVDHANATLYNEETKYVCKKIVSEIINNKLLVFQKNIWSKRKGNKNVKNL